jgi:hypothetical protein
MLAVRLLCGTVQPRRASQNRFFSGRWTLTLLGRDQSVQALQDLISLRLEDSLEHGSELLLEGCGEVEPVACDLILGVDCF